MAFLRASAALSASSHADTHNPFRFSSSSSAAFLRLGRRSGKDGVLVAMAAARETNSRPLADVVFEPFEELKKEQQLVPQAPQASLARHKYSLECEDAINQRINIEYTVSYVYHAMYAYFDRDNVALKGLAKFFKEACDEEREHAEMEYQVATKHNDAQMANFIESEFLTEQVDVIKKISEYVAQLRRVGKGHGVWHFDQMLLHEEAAA